MPASRGPWQETAAWLAERPRLAVTVALFVVPAILMRDAILGTGVVYQRDVHLYWHAEAEAFVRAVMAGAWPVWDRTLGFGQPFLANASAQVLYPLTWLNLVMRPWWYYTLFVVVHLVVSAAGMYCAARRLSCSRPAALAGAMLWTACGPFISMTILWHHFAGAAWMPWVVAAALALAADRTVRSALVLACVLAAQQLAGSFDMSTMGALLAAAVILFELRWPRPWTVASDRRVMWMAAGGFLLAIGLSAGQWMATVEAASYSGRRSLPREIRTYWSVHPVVLADLVLPGLSGDAPVPDAMRKEFFEGREPFLASLYLGLPAAALVLAAFAHRGAPRIRWFLAAVGVVALLVALGRHAPVYDLVVAIAPPLKAFRYPVKAMVLVALPWCLLAAIGFDAWRQERSVEGGDDRRIRAMAVSLPLFALAAAAALRFLGANRGARNAALAAAFGLAVAFAAHWRMRPGTRRTFAAAGLAAAIAIADLISYHRGVNQVAPASLYTHRPDVLRHVGDIQAARVYAYDYSVPPGIAKGPPVTAPRIARLPAGWDLEPASALAQQMALVPVAASRWGLQGSYEVDYTGLFPVHVNQAAYFLRSLEGTDGHRRMLELAGVTHVVATHEGPFADLRPVAVLPELYEAPVRVFSVPAPMPRTYIACRTRAAEGLAAVALLADATFDFRTEALIPAGAAPGPGAGEGTSRIVEALPDRLRVEVDAPGGGYLVVLESYAPGWRATVDGVAAPVIPVNALFRGVPLARGSKMVEMVYRPPGLVGGLVVSAVSVLGALLLAWRGSQAGSAA